MRNPANGFKRALKLGEPVYGLWLGLPDPSCAEICAGAGFDWLVVDTEHAPFDLPAVLRHLQVTAAYDVPVIVRAVDGNPALLKQLLDMGAQSVLVPMVETLAQAELLSQAVRYPPAGFRGVGTALARAARWGGIAGYVRSADAEICLIVQAETVAALENLDDIAAVPGIDGVFIGPADLAASMGYPGEPGHGDVRAAIEDAIRRIVKAGKAAGVLALEPGLVQAYERAGATFIGIGTDTRLLAEAATALARRYREP